MRGGAAVTFPVSGKAREKRVQKNFRIGESYDRYLRQAAKAKPSGEQTEVLEESLALNRDLSQRLLPVWARVQAFAAESGLDLTHTLDDLPEALARLVEVGLTSWEREGKRRR